MNNGLSRIAPVVVVLVLIAAGAGGWWYLNRSTVFPVSAVSDGTRVAIGWADVQHISGVAPFSVIFVFHPYGPGEANTSSRLIDFGDGSSGQIKADPSERECGPTEDCPPNQHYASHIYSTPGTYTAVLTEGDRTRGIAVISVLGNEQEQVP